MVLDICWTAAEEFDTSVDVEPGMPPAELEVADQQTQHYLRNT